MSSYETLIVERRGHVGWLIFNRPEALNAHNLPMLEGDPRAWQELSDDDDVRVIVNTGRAAASRPAPMCGRSPPPRHGPAHGQAGPGNRAAGVAWCPGLRRVEAVITA